MQLRFGAVTLKEFIDAVDASDRVKAMVQDAGILHIPWLAKAIFRLIHAEQLVIHLLKAGSSARYAFTVSLEKFDVNDGWLSRINTNLEMFESV